MDGRSILGGSLPGCDVPHLEQTVMVGDQGAMHPLHMTKVAVGCRTLAQLTQRQAGRVSAHAGVPAVACWTRFMPKRADDLVGGSIYWIVKHTLTARQTILGFRIVETERGKRCEILLSPDVVPVLAAPLRAHQGWRYLDAAAAPPDLDSVGAEIGALPVKMMRDLRGLGLL
jgi:hypothetical protein